VDLVLKKAENNNLLNLLTFMENNNVLLKILKKSSDNFAIKVFRWFTTNSNPQLNSIFNNMTFKELDDDGMSIFHYIALRETSQLFYDVLDFLKVNICQNNSQLFKKTLELLLNQTSKESSQQEGRFSPYEFAILCKFYEMTTFITEFQIPVQYHTNELFQTTGKYKYLPSNEPSNDITLNKIFSSNANHNKNDFNALHVSLSKIFFKTLELIRKLRLANFKNLSKNFATLVERFYFQPLLNATNESPFSDKGNLTTLKHLFLDTIFVRIHPEVIPLLLAHYQIWELNPILVIYLISKLPSDKDRVNGLGDLMQNYLIEIQSTTSEVSREENLSSKLWLDSDLATLIDEIRKLLSSEQIEARVFDTLPELFSEQNIQTIADKFNAKGYISSLKILIQLYPHIFFKLPKKLSDINQMSNINFWLQFVNRPDFMCKTISLLNSQNFKSLVSTKVNDILQLLEESNVLSYHELKSFVWCLCYIGFSLRGEKDIPTLSKENLPELMKKLLRLLIAQVNSPIDPILLTFQKILIFASTNSLCYEKVQSVSLNTTTLFSIGSELKNLLRPGRCIEIEDNEIDKQLDVCLNTVMKHLKEEENPLIIYPNIILILLRFFSIIQEIAYMAVKFNIIIKLSFKENPSPLKTDMEKN